MRPSRAGRAPTLVSVKGMLTDGGCRDKKSVPIGGPSVVSPLRPPNHHGFPIAAYGRKQA